MTIHEHLKSIGACQKAQEWAESRLTGQQCWDECDKIDWLLWWTNKCGQYGQLANYVKLIANSVAHLDNKYSKYAAAYADAAAAVAADAAHAAAVAADAADAADAAAYAVAYTADIADVAADATAAAAYAAAYAADTTAYAAFASAAAANAREKQKSLNLKIAKENLTCPFPG